VIRNSKDTEFQNVSNLFNISCDSSNTWLQKGVNWDHCHTPLNKTLSHRRKTTICLRKGLSGNTDEAKITLPWMQDVSPTDVTGIIASTLNSIDSMWHPFIYVTMGPVRSGCHLIWSPRQGVFITIESLNVRKFQNKYH
jgi:hypothetical protein